LHSEEIRARALFFGTYPGRDADTDETEEREREMEQEFKKRKKGKKKTDETPQPTIIAVNP
jgi:hypothetical protein